MSYLDWLGWFGPKGMQPSQISALNNAVNDALTTPAMLEVFQRNALEPWRISPDQFAAILKQEHAYWGNVVKATGYKPED
jgi:tripartite-type tricarboxylate transporter receptor subunit TctC